MTIWNLHDLNLPRNEVGNSSILGSLWPIQTNHPKIVFKFHVPKELPILKFKFRIFPDQSNPFPSSSIFFIPRAKLWEVCLFTVKRIYDSSIFSSIKPKHDKRLFVHFIWSVLYPDNTTLFSKNWTMCLGPQYRAGGTVEGGDICYPHNLVDRVILL